MERTRKSWGIKNNLFQNDLCEVSILELEPDQRCSWHSHRAKSNQFYVISGTLYVKLIDGTTEVEAGQIFTTRPGEMHEFQTRLMPTMVQEIMYVQYDAEDIDRKNRGGKLNQSDISSLAHSN